MLIEVAAVVSWSGSYQITQEGIQEMNGKQKPNRLHVDRKDQIYLAKGNVSTRIELCLFWSEMHK